jgi:hypothetical protein
MKTILNFICLTLSITIIEMRTTQAEELTKFDGKIALAKLPLDKEMAKKSFETAIFGIG